MGATAAMFAAYAHVEWPWHMLGWVGLVPGLAVIDRARSLRQAAAAGLLLCTGLVLAVFWWFAIAIAGYSGVAPGLALVLLVLAGPFVLQPQILTFALARHLARRSGAGSWRIALAGAGTWIGTEWAWPKLFADTLGHGLYGSTWLRQAADLAGAPGLTLVLLLANECALVAVRRARARGLRAALVPAAGVPALVGALLAYGAVRCAELGSAEAPVRAAMVQAGIAHYDRLAAEVGTYAAVRRILDAHFALSDATLRRDDPDFLVWPETVYPTTFGSPKSADGAAFDREIADFVARTGRPLVFGAYDAEAGNEYNAAVFLEPGAPRFAAYRKASLFPLTERVPALLDSAVVRRWLPWVGGWKPGTGAAVIPLRLRDGRTIRVAPLVCYDAVDPQLAIEAVRHGADVILTLSNDSWFAIGGGPMLHLIVSAFRSIETRRPQLRATNTGISAVIDATGALVDATRVGERTTLLGAVRPERRAWTLMLAWGNWLGPVALAMAVVLLAPAASRRLRGRPQS